MTDTVSGTLPNSFFEVLYIFWPLQHPVALSTAMKRYENALLAAHLSKTQGVMPDFGCRDDQGMGGQSSPARRGLVQPYQSRAWKREAFISSPSSTLSSRGRQLTFRLHTAAAHRWVTVAFRVKPPQECPRGTSGSCQDILLCR